MKRVSMIILFFLVLLAVLVLTLKAMDKQRNAPVVKEQNALVEQQQYEQKILIDARWGNSQDEFGLRTGREIEPLGPLTFALDEGGNIYVFDTVNRQVKKFNKEGGFEKNVVSNVFGTAIFIDANENLYLLKGHSVKQFSRNGDPVASYEIAKDIDLIEGYGEGVFRDKEGKLYVNRIQTRYCIGKPTKTEMKAGLAISLFELLSPNKQVGSETFGMPGSEPNSYFAVEWLNNHRASIKILDTAGITTKKISMETTDVFGGILFLGQDQQGAFYIETERITVDNYVHLEIRKYSLKGDMLTKIEFSNDYFTTVYKKIDIDNQGNIYHFLTTPNGVRLTKWEQK
jgi:hypothetical protein